ncbi:hypothetical protein VTG60DRAFT_4094 [Thermothelomyces hinnuleus]
MIECLQSAVEYQKLVLRFLFHLGFGASSGSGSGRAPTPARFRYEAVDYAQSSPQRLPRPPDGEGRERVAGVLSVWELRLQNRGTRGSV